MTGTDEPGLDGSLAGIPSSTLVVCHSSAAGVISEPAMADASCNAVFLRLDHIPAEDKALVLIRPDRHGTPPLAAATASAPPRRGGRRLRLGVLLEGLGRPAVGRRGRQRLRDALGDTAEQRSNGAWSDGVAVAPRGPRTTPPSAP